MLYTDLVGYLAGAFLLAMAFSKTLWVMRSLNIAGNLCFIIYGVLAGLWPVLLMNTAMLCIHLYRILQLGHERRPGSAQGSGTRN